jgi:hypothetical protein
VETSVGLTKIAPALVAALAGIKGAAKDSKNPHFRNDYASLESVIEASREPLAANGLCVFQALGEIVEGRLTCTTRILHNSGEWVQSTFQMPLSKADPQGTGSTATYARRYSLMAALNLAAVDDDAEAAQGRTAPANGQSEAVQDRRITPDSDGKDFWHCDGPGMSAYAAKKAGLDQVHDQLRNDMSDMGTSEGMKELIDANIQDIRKMPKAWRIELRHTADEAAQRLLKAA